MISKLIKKIKSFLKDDNFIYTYEILKKDKKDIKFIIGNIIEFNNNLENILKDNDFIKDKEYKHILKISEDKITSTRVLYWVTDKGKIINNPDVEIKRFLLLSEELLKRFFILKKHKGDDNNFKFNIRLLQPYIINIELIKGVLLEIKNNNIK